MKKLSDLKITQVRVYPTDMIPFHYLFSPTAVDKLRGAFRFKETGKGASGTQGVVNIPAAITFPAESLLFRQGEFTVKDKMHSVESLVFEPRRILFTILGSSEVANTFYQALAAIILEFDPDKQFNASGFLIQSDDTGCDVTLDVDIRQLLSREFVSFLDSKLLPELSNKAATAKLRGVRMAFEVSYSIKDEKLSDHNISFSPKVVLLQSAPSSPLEEKRYMVLSPTSSDTLLMLLDELGKLGNAKGRNKH